MPRCSVVAIVKGSELAAPYLFSLSLLCLSINSFLLTFRLNFAYGRYWDSATALHQMSSKWLDTAVCMAAFHYQSNQFDDIKPPVYGALPDGVSADNIRGRDRNFAGTTQAETERSIRSSNSKKALHSIRDSLLLRRRRGKTKPEPKFQPKSINSKNPGKTSQSKNDMTSTIPIPTRFQDQFLRASDGNPSYDEDETLEDRRARWRVKQAHAYHHLNRSRRSKLPSPSLFLQETAHLISLLSAVAMSTLRSDIDQAVSPVTAYVPGMAWREFYLMLSLSLVNLHLSACFFSLLKTFLSFSSCGPGLLV